jgi:hypothetical protein
MGRVELCTRRELTQCSHWRDAFATERKDHRYYQLVEDTIHTDFDYGYFAVKDNSGTVRAVQPFFILDQDLLVGLGGHRPNGELFDGVLKPCRMNGSASPPISSPCRVPPPPCP